MSRYSKCLVKKISRVATNIFLSIIMVFECNKHWKTYLKIGKITNLPTIVGYISWVFN